MCYILAAFQARELLIADYNLHNIHMTRLNCGRDLTPSLFCLGAASCRNESLTVR